MKNKFRFFLTILKRLFSNEKQKEATYYKKMFVENPHWNSPNPNDEELLRWEIIEDFLKDINSKSASEKLDILDLGCGRGWLTNLLADHGNSTGVEPIKSVSEYAKKLFPQINFIIGTSADLLKKNDFQKYDLIVTSEVIEHVPDKYKNKFIENITKLLRDQGFLIITTPRKEAQVEWNTYASPDQPIEEWMLEKEVEDLVIKRSFVRLRLERFSISPAPKSPEIEIYQLWLFQKVN